MRFILSISAVCILALGGLTACTNSTATLNANNAGKTVNTNKTVNNTATVTDAHEQEGEAPRITLADAKKDFDAGSAIFVDTRAEVQYQTEHIKGAINIPAESMETRWKDIPKGKKIIAYCS